MRNLQTDAAGRVEIHGDTATVSFERRYSQPRSEVWRALTDPGDLAQWLDTATIELRVGGKLVIEFDDGQVRGTIKELVEGVVLSYSWDEGTAHESTVRWELSDD